jgi:hypothetical protein
VTKTADRTHTILDFDFILRERFMGKGEIFPATLLVGGAEEYKLRH